MTDRDQVTGQSADQALKQAVQDAAQAAQQAKQTGQAIAQDVASLKETMATMQAASRGVGAETSAATVETEIGPLDFKNLLRLNGKIIVAEELESLRLARRQHDQLFQAHIDHVRDLQAQTLRMSTNSVTHDNDLAKQHLAHRDLATDRTWNIDEVAHLVAKTPVFLDAIAAAVAKGVQDAAKGK
jgi:flagellar hook-basal body complex protein FliE